MGRDIAGGTKEEDFTYEKEVSTDGRKGNEGRCSFEQVLSLWPYQEGSSVMSLLRKR